MNIKCTQNIYKSANGVSNVTYYILAPEGVEVRGIVQLSHGMCEYFSRYTAFAKYNVPASEKHSDEIPSIIHPSPPSTYV